MKKIRILFVLSLFITAVAATQAPSYDWPVHDPFSIIDTVSTLQFYGPTPGFHHGVDIHAPAGTAVYAPVSGVVGMGYYYPPAQTPYTYEVFIDGDDGYRWEFHHIDQDTIPKEVADLARNHGRVSSGTLLARIYDAPKFDPRILPHVHVDRIDRDGVYQNSLKVFPRFPDKTPPEIQGIYITDQKNQVVAADAPGLRIAPVSLSGKYELILDIIDIIDGAPMGDSVSRLDVSVNGSPIGGFDFSNQLPKKNYLEGVREIYKIDPIVFPDGHTLTNQVEQSAPRKFLYRFELDTAKIPLTAEGSLEIQVSAEDFSGNIRVFRTGFKGTLQNFPIFPNVNLTDP